MAIKTPNGTWTEREVFTQANFTKDLPARAVKMRLQLLWFFSQTAYRIVKIVPGLQHFMVQVGNYCRSESSSVEIKSLHSQNICLGLTHPLQMILSQRNGRNWY